jgi:hypothetical protein
MQLGTVVSLSARWLALILMRPQADEVEFLYEIMSVTGEATVMMMICLNYLKSVEVIEMEPIPPLAILVCSLLIVAGNLGAQVNLLADLFVVVADRWWIVLAFVAGTSNRAREDPRDCGAPAQQAHGTLRVLPTLHRGSHASMD